MRQLLGKSAVICFAVIILAASCKGKDEGWIRINQLGYRPGDVKVAVFMGKGSNELQSFRVIDAVTGKLVLEKDRYLRISSHGTIHKLLQAQLHGVEY